MMEIKAKARLSGGDLMNFIQAYRSSECLWNVFCPDYKNIYEKSKAYIYISQKFKISVEEVKKKINALRTTFNKEYKKVKDSKKSGCGEDEVYVPTVFWYTEMEFLTDSLTPRETISNVEIHSPEVAVEEIIEASQSLLTLPRKKRKTTENVPSCSNNRLDAALKDLKEICTQPTDEIDDFCKSVASQLKKLNELDVCELIRDIQNAITQKRIANLQKNSIFQISYDDENTIM